MKKLLLSCTLFVLALAALGQPDPKTAVGKLGRNPIFIVDSQRINKETLSTYNPESIATVMMLYDTSATKLYGDSAKDGAVIIETRSYARHRFITFFRRSSPLYDSLYTAAGNDNSFAYIINDKVQQKNYEGNLSAITDELFIGLEILTKRQLQSGYNITDKEFGILVRSKKPKDLYKADEKF